MTHKGLQKLYNGDFNRMSEEDLPDGSVIITLTSRKWKGVERFRVRDLYKPTEQELDIETGKPLPKKRGRKG